MRSIIKRFKDVMAANFEGIIDKYEKPDKMINRYLSNLENDLAEVKAETANVMAMQKGADRRVEAAKAEVLSWAGYVDAAVLQNKDDDARKFLEKQTKAEEELKRLEESARIAAENSRKMQEMHTKLVNDIDVLRAQRDELISRYTVAKTAQNMAGVTDSFASKADSNIAGFNRVRDKIIFEMDKAEAAASIEEMPVDATTALRAKYDVPKVNAEIEERLSAVKSRLGVNTVPAAVAG